MKKKATRLALALGLIILNPPRLCANVTITSPTGGNNISCDKALNSTNGAAFTALGNIVITEGAATDFAAGANQTLILTPPPGWQFNPGAGTVTFTAKSDITAASISVTSSNATVTLTVGGTAKLDTLTIAGLQVQCLDGANIPGSEYIRRVYTNPGTVTIAGIDIDYTTFGFLNELAGTARGLALQTQPGSNSSAGVLFSPQPVLQIIDQFGNLLNLNSTTVVTASLASGSGTLQGTTKLTPAFGVVTYTNLSMNTAGNISLLFTATNLASAVSTPISVAPAQANHLVFATQPGSANAGAPFGIQPVIKTKDAFGGDSTAGLPASQLVTLALTSGSGTLLGTATVDIGTSAANGIVTCSGLEIDLAATNYQLTATSAGLASATSSIFSVSPGAFNGLQLLMPGEAAAPATPTGKSGTPTAQVAGTAFSVVINAVDANWNVIKTVTDTVSLASSDSNATLPANAALVSGTKSLSVTLKTAGAASVSANDLTAPAGTATTSPTITVSAGAFSKLQILAPGETAAPGSATGKSGAPAAQTAGSSFNVVVNAVDANWNPITSAADVVGLTSTDVNAVLPVNTALSGGSASLAVTSHTAGSTAFSAKDITDSTKTSGTSASIPVAAGAYTQLQVLVPGESPAPGTATGKTGTPLSQNAGEFFNVTVNAVDANWNKIASVTDSIGLTSSDANAVLPAGANLASGTQSFSVSLKTPGSTTVSATDLSDSSKPAAASAAINVVPPLYTSATGGNAISADTTGGTYTSLTGPVYTETVSGNVGTGTIILKAPAGFVFNTATPLPTVLITGAGGKSGNINGVAGGTAAALTSVTTTQLVFTVTKSSSGGFANTLTWQNVKVRPTAGTPLASGKLTFAGTASLVSVSTNSNLGSLVEVPGAANKFAILTQPSAIATAGLPFAQQPVVQVLDKFGNARSTDSSTVVTATRNAGSGTLQGHTSVTATSGIATFADLMHTVATNITIAFSSPSATNSVSSTVSVSPAAFTALGFTVQPGNATAGSVFGIQPVVAAMDVYGNPSTVGLPKSLNIDLSLSSGSGPLQGTMVADIGTTMGNGFVRFSDLRSDSAGPGQQLKVTASGPSTGYSATFSISAGPAAQLAIQTQPSANAQAGVAFPQQPAVQVEDAFGNPRTTDNTTVVTVARNLGTGTLLGTKSATASGGVATFTNLSYTNMQTINLNFTSGSMPAVTSSSITVGPGAARKLVVLTQPSATATAGQAFAQQPQISLIDQYGNLCVNDSSTVVQATRATGSGALQGTTTMPASAGVVSFTNLSYPIAETMTVAFSGAGLTNATSSSVAVSADAFTKLLVLAPGETAAPGTATGKAGTPTAQTPDAGFNLTVNAADNNWNLVKTATDLTALNSSDLFAGLPTNAALVAGTKQFSITLSESGATNSVGASDAANGAITSSMSSVPVSARFTSATGGKAIPSSTAGVSFTALTGPVYSEKAAGEAGKGTIILNAPTGFVFDTGGVAPSVLIKQLTAIKSPSNINGVASGTSVAMTSVSATQLVFTITSASSGATCQLTWQNVRIQPTSASPVAFGKLTKSGTSTMAGVTNGVSNFGTLNELAGASLSLAITGSNPNNTTDSWGTSSSSASGSTDGSSNSAYIVTPVTMTGLTVVDGSVKLTFKGNPVSTYQIERTTSLGASASWTPIGSITTDASGNGAFTDLNAPAQQGYYRTAGKP
jgi:hypothetical protein